jgi:hypothetical protein
MSSITYLATLVNEEYSIATAPGLVAIAILAISKLCQASQESKLYHPNTTPPALHVGRSMLPVAVEKRRRAHIVSSSQGRSIEGGLHY